MTPALTDADREVLDRLATEFLEFGHEDGWLGEAIALHFLAAGMERQQARIAERDKLLLDVAASLAAAVNLLEYSCDCKDRLLDQRLKDYAASVERVRAYYAAIATAKAGQHGN